MQYIERDIWGNQTGDRSAEGSFPFTTYQYDPVIRKYFAQARFYDSVQGRMLAKDPVKRGLNGYPYCDNDPADHVDPTGEVPNIIAGGIIGGIAGGIAGFLESSVSQIWNKEKYSLRKALGAAAKGAITGAAQGALMASGAGLAKTGAKLATSLLTNFGAGFLGSMAEQKINKRRVNPREAIREGLNNSIGGALFGNSPISGLKNAIIRGARSNAAVAAINSIFDSFTPTEQDRIHDFMLNLPPGTTLVLELPGMRDDPRNECGGKSPFHDGVGYALPSATGRYNSDTNGGRKGFSLVDFLKDVAAGAVLGGLSGAVYYGGGKAVEAVRRSIRSNFFNDRYSKDSWNENDNYYLNELDESDEEHLLKMDLQFFSNTEKGRKPLKINLIPLAKHGEDLFVGTYSESKYWNKKMGLTSSHTPHHVVQDAISSVSHGRGVTINLLKEIHAKTGTFCKTRYYSNKRQHLAADVIELKKLLLEHGYTRSTVNAQLHELIRQNLANGGFQK